jgi:hypothetical protein
MNGRSTVLWRRLDMPGHEVAELARTPAGWDLSGVALVADDGRPCRLEYRIECDAAWLTRRLQLHGHLGGVPVTLEVTRNARDEWHANGRPVPQLQGCVDVDLAFSPSTNLLPIRRLGLAVGDHAAVRTAWVRFPTFSLEVLDQVYTRLGADTYRYESAGGTFRRDLTVNADGLVTEYPDLWRAEAMTTTDSMP